METRFQLDDIETRILGCLLEKQRTTPDTYPLTLNALRLACNQSTNREPVMNVTEDEIHEALQRLYRRELTRVASGHSSRSSKYRHLLAEKLALPADQTAVLCVLLLRGEQTPGELKQRCERLHPFDDLLAVEAAIDGLGERGLAERLERRPGEKQIRCRQLMSAGTQEEADDDGRASGHEGAGVEPSSTEEPSAAADSLSAGEPSVSIKRPAQIASLQAQASNGVAHEIAELRAAVGSLQSEVAELRARLDGDEEAAH